ncbi:MAG TPA: 5'-3' exonuclease H3TH domain-containing protein [Thermoanaerobaculia bacterium]|nr:5'-3' exonuclease H3TH domain-containing protein [Thermoanaerobaculia bacterium]
MTSTACLVDASPYVFRAFFSLPDSLRDKRGNPMGAVYGFASFLLKLIAEQKPAYLAVAFDRNLNSSFRNQYYPAYKAQRELPPPDLERQLLLCEEVASALGAATFADDLFEADDLIGTLCDRLLGAVAGGAAELDVLVVSTDKDLAQLVRDAPAGRAGSVALLEPGKGTLFRAAEVGEVFGVRPEQIPDLLGLAGDPVDNIPGVAGIGRKTAAALLARFGDLDDLYARLDDVLTSGLRGAKGLHQRLAGGREIAFLSRRLATISLDAPVTAGPADLLSHLLYGGADRQRVERLFEELGFGRIRERIPLWHETG